MASTKDNQTLNSVIKQVIQASSKDGQKGLNKDTAKNAQVIVEGLLNKGIKKNNSNTSKYVRDMRANYAKDLSKNIINGIRQNANIRKSNEAGINLTNKINQNNANRNFKYNESAQKAADNGMNKRDRPTIRNVTFGSNDDESRFRVRASLARNGKELNRPEYNGSPRPSGSIKTGNLINTGRVMLGNSMMGNLGANVLTPLDAHNKNLIVLSGDKGELDTVGNRVPITKDGKTYLNPETGQFEPTDLIYDEKTGMPMYFDNTRYRYVPLDADMPIPEVPNQIPSYVPMGNVPEPVETVSVSKPSFDKIAYPTLDSIFKRVNSARDLASLGTVYNPNTDTSVNNPVPELYGSNNQSTIPANQTNIPNTSNMSTPKITIGSMANAPTVTPKNTPNKPTTVASKVSTPVTTRVNPQNASMTQSVPVEEVSLSSIVKPLARRNGGFDEYRRQSALSALRNAGGISPAEGVQRGIIPYEALQYI